MSERARAPARACAVLACAALALVASGARADGELPDVVFADGTGLPAGAGTAAEGAALYAARCASCHGGAGEGGSAPELVGDPATLGDAYPDRGIAARWPHAPPLFDYVRRAMPSDAPGSLDAGQTYALVARLLELNGLALPGGRADAGALAALAMPVRDRFVDVDVDPETR